MRSLLTLSALALAATGALSQSLTWTAPVRGVAVAADAAENVYTADWEQALGGDITLSKIAPSGVVLFQVRYDNTSPTRMDAATWVETDSQGGAFVSGTVLSGYSNPVVANALLMRFAADGTLRWRTVIGSDFDGGSTFRVLRDNADNAYVLGVGPTPAGVRMRIHQVSPDGVATLLWYDPFGLGAPTAFKWGGDGSLVVAGRGTTGMLGGAAVVSTQGQTLRAATAVPALATVDAAADASGHLYIASTDPSTAKGRLARLGATFGGDWQVSDVAAFSRVEVAPDGGIVVGGMPNTGSFGVSFLKYSAQGALLWANRDADGPANSFLLHGQMRLDPQGNVYLAAGTLGQMSVTRGNADGSPGWAITAPFGSGIGLAFGASSGAVYVVGGQTARIDQGGTPPAPQADIAVTLADAPDPVRVKGQLVLTTTLRNLGTGSASGVTLKQGFSAKVRGVSVTTSQGSCSGVAPLKCSFGAIAPGGSVTVVQTVKPLAAGTLTTQATAKATLADPVPANDRATASTTVQLR